MFKEHATVFLCCVVSWTRLFFFTPAIAVIYVHARMLCLEAIDRDGGGEDETTDNLTVTISIINSRIQQMCRLTAGEAWARPTGRAIFAGKGPTICRTHRAEKQHTHAPMEEKIMKKKIKTKLKKKQNKHRHNFRGDATTHTRTHIYIYTHKYIRSIIYVYNAMSWAHEALATCCTLNDLSLLLLFPGPPSRRRLPNKQK